MTDRPIIFTAPEVRATLDGRKTQFRVVLKPQPKVFRNATPFYRPHPQICPNDWYCCLGDKLHAIIKVPYAPGDSLWVRESFIAHGGVDHCIQGYRADGYEATEYWEIPRPSVHMPRWASRLTLTVTDVRVQKLQDISEDDARAEGMLVSERLCELGSTDWPEFLSDYREAFSVHWNRRHAKRGFGWDANPWVAAVTFMAERRNIGDEHG